MTIDQQRLAQACTTGAARARERARYLARRGESPGTVEYQHGRAAALEQLAAILNETGYLPAMLADLEIPPAFLGGPNHEPPGWTESPDGRINQAHGIT